MTDEPTLPGSDQTDTTDSTDSNLITDFTQVASCAVGNKRAERQRLRDYISGEQHCSPSLKSFFSKLFKID